MDSISRIGMLAILLGANNVAWLEAHDNASSQLSLGRLVSQTKYKLLCFCSPLRVGSRKMFVSEIILDIARCMGTTRFSQIY